ncbi:MULTISPECIES: phenylacetic acid degradation operon negative regulatory protein PaaX [unclassified Oceanobacter]|uniref:phenylacetic acid degradation operon negative regulatory protein PaaX n=1 Tax=unclassified Oceanobacter TaxID=2620260 RepID=UPI0027332CA6|nr:MULTISPECIES: phenylacetic acid degradation operon negative regulatory protein PaaX [unclassified Oceanobacter]MDP2609083.1 phenylacetic acid degradation operon negative regulatory protein PaaX [Oceanobacter sp. 1_MG-2023]MDP2612405.1 phenylacetic acid degradation operon negative regulatory protein PaaX [Oceanobacter sp. 2_MG-2023]
MKSLNTLDAVIKRFQSQTPMRATSLVITIYGDAIEPHGGTVWLGSLIKLLEPIGINERLMRTTIFRLTQDGWLMSDKVGRRSYYSLTDPGRRKFKKAFRRVYSSKSAAWDGSWSLILTQQLSPEQRKQLLDELEWQGFGVLSPGLLGSPRANSAEVNSALSLLELSDKVVLFETSAKEELLTGKPIRMLVRDSWGLPELGARYQDFIDLFRPMWQELNDNKERDQQACFLARILLIHEYRKLVLRDPLLPEELLPGDWEGRAARQLCRNIYRSLTPHAEQWIAEQLETAEGPLPAASASFYQRFDGLKPQTPRLMTT